MSLQELRQRLLQREQKVGEKGGGDIEGESRGEREDGKGQLTTSIHCLGKLSGYWSHIVVNIKGFPGSSVVKNLPAKASPGLGRFLEMEMATYLVFLPGKFHGQKGLAGSQWGCKRVGHD